MHVKLLNYCCMQVGYGILKTLSTAFINSLTTKVQTYIHFYSRCITTASTLSTFSKNDGRKLFYREKNSSSQNHNIASQKMYA